MAVMFLRCANPTRRPSNDPFEGRRTIDSTTVEWSIRPGSNRPFESNNLDTLCNLFYSLLFCRCCRSPHCGRRIPERLSLSDAIQVGLSENFGIRIEQQNVEIARNNNTWGAAGRWPTISLNVSQNNNFRDVDNPASFLQGLSISNDITPFVGVSWVLFDGFRVVANRERLQALERLSEGNAQVVIENAVQGIITQYYLVQLEQQRLSVLNKVFQLSKDRYAYVKLRSELGSAVTFDVLQELNAFLTDSSNYVTQEITAINARRNLNLLMGQEVGERYRLTDSLEVTPNDYGIEDLYERDDRQQQQLA